MSVTTPSNPLLKSSSVTSVFATSMPSRCTTATPPSFQSPRSRTASGPGAAVDRRPVRGGWPARSPKPLGRKPRVAGVAVGLDSLRSGP